MAIFTLLDDNSAGVDVRNGINRLNYRDSGAANYGQRIVWDQYDGVELDPRTGASLSTGNYTLKIRNGAGKHLWIRNAAGTGDVLRIDDTGLIFFDWTVTLSGDDLLFKDDSGTTIITFGDASSAYQLTVTGKLFVSSNARVVGLMQMDAKATVGTDLTVAQLTGLGGVTTPLRALHLIVRGDTPQGITSGSDTEDAVIIEGDAAALNFVISGAAAALRFSRPGEISRGFINWIDSTKEFQFGTSTTGVNMRLTGDKLGFFGSGMVSRPAVTGVRTGTLGQLQTVVQNILTAIGQSQLNLVLDSTT